MYFFGPSLPKKQVATLEKLQYTATRLTTGAMIRTSGEKCIKRPRMGKYQD